MLAQFFNVFLVLSECRSIRSEKEKHKALESDESTEKGAGSWKCGGEVLWDSE